MFLRREINESKWTQGEMKNYPEGSHQFTDIIDPCPIYRFQIIGNSLLCFKYSYVDIK